MRGCQLLLGLLFVISTLSSCTKVGPDNMLADRFDYTAAVADSWNEQVLLNIVRLRYSAWPVFVGIDQIVTAYTLEHTGSAKFIARRGISDVLTNDQAEAGWVGRYIERPTVIYKPLSGKKYVGAFLTPVQPASVFALMETGWPADHLGRIALRSVNEHYNANASHGLMFRTDVKFESFLKLLKELQSVDGIKINIEKKEKKSEKVRMYFFPERLTASLRADLQHLKVDLGLDLNLNVYEIVRSSLANDPGEIRIQGRSILQVLIALASGVEIPEKHRINKIAPGLAPIPEHDQSSFAPLMVVKSGSNKPADAFVSVKYQDMWFWIENTDHDSKRSLVYALALITLLDSDDSSGGSVVIPVN